MAEPTDIAWCAARLTGAPALAAGLGLPPDAPDAAIVAAAVAHHGADAPDRLPGPFAYALRAGGTTVITRDALGLMPAFWVRDADGVVHVSDSLAALHDVPGVDLTPDAEFAASLDLRAAGQIPTRTGTVGVHRVPAGCVVTIPDDPADGGPVVERWWRPESGPGVRRISVDAAAAELHALLRAVGDDTVETVVRLGGGTPPRGVAAHVSGGLDSTTVAYLTAEALSRQGLRLGLAVSWSPDAALVATADAANAGDRPVAYDERALITRIAADLGTPAWFGPAEIAEAPWLAELDLGRFPRETTLRESHVTPAMPERGIAHVVSGWGGDEFVSFNGRTTNQTLVRSLRLGALREGYRDRRRRGRRPVQATWATVRPGLPSWFPGGRRETPEYTGRLQRRIDAATPRFPDLVDALMSQNRRFGQARNPRQFQLAMITNGHLDRRIDAWHQMGLRYGVAYHYPLLDRRLVEWSLTVPPEAWRVGEHSRRVFRMAIAGIVPEEIRDTVKDDPVLLALIKAEADRRRAAGIDQPLR